MTSVRSRIVRALYEAGEEALLTVSQVCEASGMSPSTVRTTLGGLEGMGLVVHRTMLVAGHSTVHWRLTAAGVARAVQDAESETTAEIISDWVDLIDEFVTRDVSDADVEAGLEKLLDQPREAP